MTRHVALVVAFAATVLVPWSPAIGAPTTQPNVLLIMGDDHAWPIYRFMWEISEAQIDRNNPRHEELKDFPHDTFHPDFQFPDELETPGLDRLAARGAVFPVGHTGATVCIPSFQSTLTGLYRKDFDRPPPARIVSPYIPEYLAQVGYQSFGYGKIWQSNFGDAGFSCVPGSSECTTDSERSRKLARVSISPLLEFIAREQGPWFAFYGANLPHAPFNGMKVARATLFGDRGPVLNLGSPYLTIGARERFAAVYDRMLAIETSYSGSPRLKKLARYLNNILVFDFWVGEILNFLERPGNEALNANTMIILLSDNGYRMPHSKRSFGENGFRTPILVSWPGPDPNQPRIRPNQILPQMVHAIDILPTLLDYAGMPTLQCPPGSPVSFPPWAYHSLPEGSGSPCLEGQSMRPYLEGSTSPGRQYLFGVSKHDDRYLRVLRMEPLGVASSLQHAVAYRLILQVKRGRRGARCQFHLYNLHIDPDETRDLMRFGGFDNRDGSLETWQNQLLQWDGPAPCLGG